MTAATLVERVAEAIAIAGNGGTWDDWYNPAQKEFHRKRARAAIEAMREPTAGMICVGNQFTDWASGADDAWQAMIDEALKGEG